jgi:hypothetical protein
MTTRLNNAPCWTCVYYRGERNCTAFDGEIPLSIWSGKSQHRKPVDGDGGKLYLSIFDDEEDLEQ